MDHVGPIIRTPDVPWLQARNYYLIVLISPFIPLSLLSFFIAITLLYQALSRTFCLLVIYSWKFFFLLVLLPLTAFLLEAAMLNREVNPMVKPESIVNTSWNLP